MRSQQLIARLQLKPAQSLALSFLGVILLGTVLLKLPLASAAGKTTSLIDALFTATSATCVTGLVVVDTPTHFSIFGQVVILLLIQTGGLGIMTLSTSLALIFGRRMGLRNKLAMQDVLDQVDVEGMKKLILYILKMTLVIELIGALLLFLRWSGSFGELRAAYLAVFHSVSAFCNAGFSLFSNSFVNYRFDVMLNLIITFLIILGGIGFTVVADIQHTWLRRGKGSKPTSLTAHTKLVLIVSALLLLGGTLAVFFGEYHN
ncbi:MAG: Trk family potassium uptake protein, partial [Candidatus Latescibacteria bacterium]|nr:Trk family potassium uptake protein [Candidatus Latescibacterota bacterium]